MKTTTDTKRIKFETKYRNWFFNRAVNAQKIHHNKRSRQKFRRYCWLFFAILLIGYCVVSALLFTAGLRFYLDGDPSQDSSNTDWYVANIKDVWAFAIAITLFCILFIISFVAAIYIPVLYKQSKQLYSQSDEFQQHVLKYQNMDLKRMHIKEIKWLKKLGYIDRSTYLFYKKPKKK